MRSHSLTKYAVLAPPTLLLVGSVALLMASPFSWGAGQDVDLPGWITTFSGLMISLPGLGVSLLAIREILRRSSGDFTVSLLQMWMPAFAMIVVAALELILAFRITDSGTYESLRNDEGEIVIGPGMFLFITLVGTAMLAGIASVGGYAFVQGITSESSRFSKQASELDAMGEILRSGRP